VTDLGSTNGTLANGRSVRGEAILAHGDRFEAGETVWRVEIADAPDVRADGGADVSVTLPGVGAAAAVGTAAAAAAPIEIFTDVEPSTVERPAVEPAPDSPLAHLLEAVALGGPEERLYALVDGASAADLAVTGRVLGHRLYTLFEGDMAAQVAHAGPILIPLDEEPLAFLARWAEVLGKNAGVLLQTQAELGPLHAHLRHVFVCSDEEGSEYFLRFYDPRVLRGFLPTCDAEQRTEFFGPVQRFLVEAEAGDRYEVVSPS
jgi:hypothetical protein